MTPRWPIVAALVVAASWLAPPSGQAAAYVDRPVPLVFIEVFSRRGEPIVPIATGTGWLVTYDGYIVTAGHVVAGKGLPPDQLMVKGTLAGTTTPFDVDVVRSLSPDRDIALLKATNPPKADIFAHFHFRPLIPGTPFHLLGFPERGNPPQPRQYPSEVSAEGRLKFFGSARVAPGLSGGPALLTQAGRSWVVAIALAERLDGQGRVLNGEFLAVSDFWDVLVMARQRGRVDSGTPLLPVRLKNIPREGELTRTIASLQSGSTVLVTGGPGMEVREFVIELGYRLADDWQVPGAHVIFLNNPTTDSLVSALTQQLAVYGAAGLSPEQGLDEIRRRLGNGEKYLLVAADVVDPAVADTLNLIRESVPLIVGSSSHFVAPAFDVTQQLSGLDRKICVRFFAEEAGTPASADDGDEICRLLGGTPQAVRLVARLLGRGRAPRQAILRALKSGSLDLDGGLAPLQKAYELAYDGLGSEGKLLARLSVIGGDSFDDRAARATNGLDVDLALWGLARRNLIDQISSGRYRMNPLTRTFLAKKLDASDRLAALRAMTSYYLRESATTVSALELEWTNIAHAFDSCRLLPDAEISACQGAGVTWLGPTMKAAGRTDVLQTWTKTWLDSATTDAERRAAFLALATTEFEVSGHEAAATLLDSPRPYAEDPRDPNTVRLLLLRGRVAYEPSRNNDPQSAVLFASAEKVIRRAVDLARAIGDARTRDELLARAYRALGFIAGDRGDCTGADRWFTDSIALAEGSRASDELNRSRFNLGVIALRRGRYEDAKIQFTKYQQAIPSETLEEQGRALYMLAHVSLGQDDVPEAVRLLQAAKDAFERSGSPNLTLATERLRLVRTEASAPRWPACIS